MAEIKPEVQTFARIKVVGLGGGGGEGVNRMINSNMQGVDFIAVNSDAQALHNNLAPKKIHIGPNTTRGLGTGGDPDLGKAAADESREDIKASLKGADMVFITAGQGGGTGTGGAPIVAEVAREQGALTVAFVTKPFSFEGHQRLAVAERGIEELRGKVDALIVIPNDKVLQVVDKKTPILEAFGIVDEVLRQGVQGIADLITQPGLINRDFRDVQAIMKDAGSALMAIGRAGGEQRAVEAAKLAISSPLIDLSVKGAKNVLLNVTGSQDLSMSEVEEAANVIKEHADPNARIIWGMAIDPTLNGEVKITVIATGFDASEFEAVGTGPAAETAEQAAGADATPLKTIVDAPLPYFQNEKVEEEEDELDVPAFIRKKME